MKILTLTVCIVLTSYFNINIFYKNFHRLCILLNFILNKYLILYLIKILEKIVLFLLLLF